MSSRVFVRQLLSCALVIFLAAPQAAFSQTSGASPSAVQPNSAPLGGDPWPRQLSGTGATILIYQPQVKSWLGNLLDAYAAVSIKTAGGHQDYGVIWFTTRTEVDKVNRVVTLEDFILTKQNFPSLANNGAAYTGALKNGAWIVSMPLDELQSSLAAAGVEQTQQKVAVENTPPRIIFSTVPAVLALIDGQPVYNPAPKLQKIVNTRALIVLDTEKHLYYLALMDGWVEANSLDGAWQQATHEPRRDLDKIRKAALDDDQNQVLGNPKQSLKEAYDDFEVPAVYVSITPAELVMTQGQPQFSSILGTNLLYVNNTGSDIFMDTASSQYYLLIAGRWFISPSMQNGPWNYVAATALPPDFAKIPDYSPKAAVLVSVPGTPQAKEALIANQIPQTASINRAKAKLTLNYFGAPDFQHIAGTSMTYAVNSTIPVIDVPGNTYYACQGGVWFSSAVADGPWTVAAVVPDVIYSIPPSSPIYYVTYVRVYGYTPDVVYVGYTPGYYGTVVSADGVVVYGTGYIYSPFITPTIWVPAPVTYGVGATFGWSAWGGWGVGFGLGMSVGVVCGPWWGPVGWYGWGYAAPVWGWGAYGGVASANFYGHWGNAAYSGTRAAWANPYTGNEGAAGRGSFYNPATGARGAGERGYNYNAYNGNYAAGSRGAAYNPKTGVVAGGAHGVAGNTVTGSSGSVNRGFAYNTNTKNGAAYNNGNVYASHDGNVYRANPGSGSGWQENSGSGWNDVTKSTPASSSLDSEAAARDQGAQRWGNFQSSGWGGQRNTFGGANPSASMGSRFGSSGFGDGAFHGGWGGGSFGNNWRSGGGFGGFRR